MFRSYEEVHLDNFRGPYASVRKWLPSFRGQFQRLHHLFDGAYNVQVRIIKQLLVLLLQPINGLLQQRIPLFIWWVVIRFQKLFHSAVIWFALILIQWTWFGKFEDKLMGLQQQQRQLFQFVRQE